MPFYNLKQDDDISESKVESMPASLMDDIQIKKKLLASIGIGLYDDDEGDNTVKEEYKETVDKEVHDEGVYFSVHTCTYG
jgi:hypothetical protein